ncbi:MAG: amidohydrolase family protein [Candidatus Dormibacteraeota bacterium]|nr:amidohydrolase family protein [Candidatus Dormibacteraeota bacterium]MBO0746051.1 amidohydrolase family protein [Candidatus Dormibacteraeota bacterium]
MTRTVFDSHHHLWRKAATRRAGILGEPYLDREFGWKDLADAWGDLDVAGTCLVEATSEPEEVGLAEETSARDPRLRAMVAFAAVEEPGLGEALEVLSRHPIVRGIRRSTQAEADPEFILRPEFVAGARLVGGSGLLLELCVRHEQIDAVPRLARECPETVIVVQHLGKPEVSTAPGPGWLRAVDQLGACPNVHCKISPVVHTALDPRFTLERQSPFIQHAVTSFGWARVVFGSNWPVSTAVTTYPEWVEIVTAASEGAGATAADLEALFLTNAQRLYGDDRR